MRRTFGILPVSLVFAIPLLLPAGAAGATWPHDTFAGNVPLCTAAYTQYDPVIATDGAGGAIVAWYDYRSGGYDIYAQRVTATGAVSWTANGVALCTAAGDQTAPAIVVDGAGGAIVTWHDVRSGGFDIYAQRISAAGVVQWTANGVALSTATGNQADPAVVSDGAGGAIVTWYDYRSGSTYDIYAQRINATGTVQWTANGVALCTAAGHQRAPAIAMDGAGGAIVSWEDERSGTADVYTQRISAAGTVQWAANGVALCTATGDQTGVAILADGAGGAIVAWNDQRTVAFDVYAQRISATGTAQWTANGVALCTATGYQDVPALVTDGAGGAIVAWEDSRTGVADVYAQRVNSTGSVQWTADGVAVCTADGSQPYPNIAADGTGGAIVVWYDMRSGTYDIYAQRISATGTAQWTANGVALCTATGSQYNPTAVSDGAGGAIVTWYDIRSGTSNDIYAQRIDHFGYLGAEPSIVAVRDIADDQGGYVKVSWSPSWLDGVADLNLAAYDVYRSAPSTAPAGGTRVLANFGEHAAPGERTWVRQAHGAQVFYWEYVGSVSAAHFPSGYSFVAATTGDSIAGSNRYTAFLVVGRNSSGTKYWPSTPDSGYSVDNLPPGAVSPFSATYAGGAATLHWGQAGEADFASYRLHRGASASFVPAPANLVVDQPDTGYVDVVGSLNYYKIASVDVHGNVGPYSTVLPAGVVGVGDPHTLPAALSLVVDARSDGTVALHWALPQSGDARLTVYAANGRRVLELESGAHGAGEYVTHWNGRDASGAPVASGVYLVRLAVAGRMLDARVLRLP